MTSADDDTASGSEGDAPPRPAPPGHATPRRGCDGLLRQARDGWPVQGPAFLGRPAGQCRGSLGARLGRQHARQRCATSSAGRAVQYSIPVAPRSCSARGGKARLLPTDDDDAQRQWPDRAVCIVHWTVRTKPQRERACQGPFHSHTVSKHARGPTPSLRPAPTPGSAPLISSPFADVSVPQGIPTN